MEEKQNKEQEDANRLSEARFKFALKCLRKVVQIKTSENVVFSPYSIHDGLILAYFETEIDRGTNEHLKRILEVPAHLDDDLIHECFTFDIDNEKKKDRERAHGYYNVNSWEYCNLNSGVFSPDEKLNDISNLMHRINEEIRNEIEGHMRQPVEINGLDGDVEYIISSILRFKGDIFLPELLTDVPDKHLLLEKPRTVLSPKLGMFVTELPIIIKTATLFLLFPAVQLCIPNSWEIDHNISGLVERLTTKEGADELRKVLDKQESSTKKLSTESVIYPDFFELENDLPLEKLLELPKPDMARRPNIVDDKNQHLSAMHRAYLKVTSENVIAGAVNMLIYEENKGSFKSMEETNYSQYKNSFVPLIYEKVSRSILFIGIINRNIELSEVSKRHAQRYFVEHK